MSIALVAIATLAGCASTGGKYGNQGVEEYIPDEDDYYRGPEPDAAPPPKIQAVPGAWYCFYDPTMNDNWHDDVLCQNMDDYKRPQLLVGDSYITYEEIMDAASEYEDQLNAK